MKYYVLEHQKGYQRIAREGKASWDELHGSQGFEDAAIRQILATVLTQCTWDTSSLGALEVGCGTGPGACYLAEQGFAVTGIDLDPLAIELAKREAAQRGLKINYIVGDLCVLPLNYPPFDLIVDAFCLQSIVLDADRVQLFDFVRHHLLTEGYYLIASAGFSPLRSYAGARFDTASGIVYTPLEGKPDEIEGAVRIDGGWYQPYRRHLRAEQLAVELTNAHWHVVWQQVEPNGNLIFLCQHRVP